MFFSKKKGNAEEQFWHDLLTNLVDAQIYKL